MTLSGYKENPSRHRSARWMGWILAALSYLLVWAVVLLFPNLFRRELVMDRESTKESIQQATARGKALRKAEAQRRAQRKISVEHQEKLREETDQRMSRKMLARVSRLEDVRNEMIKIEAEEIKAYQKEALNRERKTDLQRMHRMFGKLRQDVQDIEEQVRNEPGADLLEQEKMNQEASRLDDRTAALRETPENEDLGRATHQSAQELNELLKKELNHIRKLQNQDGISPQQKKNLADIRKEVAKTFAQTEGMKKRLDDLYGDQQQNLVNRIAPPPKDPGPDKVTRDQPLESMPISEMYNHAAAVEREISERFNRAKTARLATARESNFDKTAGLLTEAGAQERPDLAGDLNAGRLDTVGGLNKLRDQMRQAIRETDHMEALAMSQLGQLGGTLARQNQMGRPMNATIASSGSRSQEGGGGGTGNDDSAHRNASSYQSGQRFSESGNERTGLTMEGVVPKALPGRRLTSKANREGWMYIDTWYVIGPWEREPYVGKPLPPQYEINLDAEYTNGKIGEWQDPRTEEMMNLDGRVSWKFVQSDSIYIQPPQETGDAIYFAYTEIYSDRDRSVLVALGIDDVSKTWINGKLIYAGMSEKYKIGDNMIQVQLVKGRNPVLIRMENGAPFMSFSMVITTTN